MRTDRIFTPQPLAAGAQIALEAGARRHVTQVLRLAAGDPLVLFNGDGRDYAARLLDTGETALVEVLDAGPEEPAPPLALTLALGISRGERMDYALQKAVELGAAALVPLFTQRSLVKLKDDRLEKRLRHWHGVVVAACEQSGRRRLPALAAPSRLGAWLAALPPTQPGMQPGTHQGVLLHHAAERALPELPAPVSAGDGTGALTLLVGPEGGLAADERAAAEARGFVPVRLGPRVMRTETAPLAALAAIQALWGDFRG
ncbi:16S rRNA (uracil(1498)-N(3))-methyltransferase [uncultured Thiohalocapsa sp.]|uniref:16S rRNA (uracil(1498)-N(3))-methyltransferase n=1 Tax=uncultured Thiohalocapsa sp. TaxID=768990 RepID=UPI0025E56ECE|nr:16S rRNA (uracil(1498)-N(3))-methyltransferase [uncultured Thiohalocapsa sp.]